MADLAHTTDTSHQLAPSRVATKSKRLSHRVQLLFQARLSQFPWKIVVRDWTGQSYTTGGNAHHWAEAPLIITIRTESAAEVLLAYDVLGFLDKFVDGEVDLEGNLYLISLLSAHANIGLNVFRMLWNLLTHSAFQSTSRAERNVKSHYDIPQEALNLYLDKKYMSYSCGMFEHPKRLERSELIRVGQGEEDSFDSLERSQWRKFKDAVDFLCPKEGETLLDVGCGYGGQLLVALASHPFGKVVGWTHSANQVGVGREWLSKYDETRWELNQGDYREEDRVFDHVTSTGMISHVGPRGLRPYVRNVRSRIKKGGRYLHHALMLPYLRLPLNCYVGYVFNKKYVWPGFHWFTLGTHVKTLEANGFEVQRVVNLSPHYAKTTASWYERMMERQGEMRRYLDEPEFRAWQVFLAGITGSFQNKGCHVYRLYCEAL